MYSVLVFARVLLGHTFETNLTTSSLASPSRGGALIRSETDEVVMPVKELV